MIRGLLEGVQRAGGDSPLPADLCDEPLLVSLTPHDVRVTFVGVTGLMKPGEVFSIPAEREGSTGLIEDGISGVTGAVILVLFILALAQLLADSGLMRIVLTRLEAQAAEGVRSAELTIVGVSLLFSIPLGANAAAILLVGPTLARPLGMSHNLAPARTANLLDCSVCTVFYMLPWHNAVIVWYATVLVTATTYGLPVPSIATAFQNPYAWALLVVLLISILTGWNRRYAKQSTPTAAAHASRERDHATCAYPAAPVHIRSHPPGVPAPTDRRPCWATGLYQTR